MRTICCCLAVVATMVATTAHADDAPVKGQWVNISDTLAQQAGKPKDAVTNLGVEPVTGDLYVGYAKAGLWKSTDQGKTFELADGGKYTTMGVSSYSFDFDTAGKRFLFWGMYGPALLTLDGGKTWQNAGSAMDWGAVDWRDPEAKTMWACPHGGGSIFSFDAGKTWNKRPEDKLTAFGIFDRKTFAGLLVDAVFLSTDGGDSFTKKGKRAAPAPDTCMRIYKGAAYWVSSAGILVSRDKGATWMVQGKPISDPIAGPFFGQDAQHMVVVTRESFLETDDGGTTWTATAPALADKAWDTDKGETRWCRFFAWDAARGVYYGGKLNSSAMKFVREGK